MAGPTEVFGKLPVELQGMIAVEALRRPGINYITVIRDASRSRRWFARLQALPKKFDTSSFRLFDKLTRELDLPVMQKAIIAATKDQEHIVINEGTKTREKALVFAMDMDTELVLLDFARGKSSGRIPFRWYEYDDQTRARLSTLKSTFRPFRKVAVEYRNSWKSCVGWKVSTPFQCWCPQPERDDHQSFKLCPRELANMLCCFENLEEFFLVITQPPGKVKTPGMPSRNTGVGHRGMRPSPIRPDLVGLTTFLQVKSGPNHLQLPKRPGVSTTQTRRSSSVLVGRECVTELAGVKHSCSSCG